MPDYNSRKVGNYDSSIVYYKWCGVDGYCSIRTQQSVASPPGKAEKFSGLLLVNCGLMLPNTRKKAFNVHVTL